MCARTSWIGPGLVLFAMIISTHAVAQNIERAPGELVWAIRYDPKSFDPAKVDEQVSETVRFLTGGVLLRFNPQAQVPQPELAESWNVSADGHVVSFRLRGELHFSDGASLTSQDVGWSLRRVLAAATAAPVAEEFITPLQVTVETPDPRTRACLIPRRGTGEDG